MTETTDLVQDGELIILPRGEEEEQEEGTNVANPVAAFLSSTQGQTGANHSETGSRRSTCTTHAGALTCTLRLSVLGLHRLCSKIRWSWFTQEAIRLAKLGIPIVSCEIVFSVSGSVLFRSQCAVSCMYIMFSSPNTTWSGSYYIMYYGLLLFVRC